MFRSPKRSATGFQNKVKFKLPEGKGKNKRQFLKVFRKFKTIIIISIPVLLILILILIEYTFAPFSVVNINPTNFTLTQQDRSAIIGKKLYLINQDTINSVLLPNHIPIQSFEIKKKYPSTIEITAENRKGVFKIKNDKSYLIIDEFGVVFENVKDSKLPDLPIKVKEINVGTILEKSELQLFSKVVKSLLDFKLQVSSIYLEGEYIDVLIKDKYIIRFNQESYVDEIILFRKAITMIDSEGEKISEVRFVENKVVIEYDK